MAKIRHIARLRWSVKAWNKWRATHPKTTPDLTRVYLPTAHLTGADLRGANLKEAKLWAALLGEADLREADLNHVNLKGAVLGDANLGGAYLEGANLEGALLVGANLEGAMLGTADLRSALLRGANLGGTNLGGVDFRGADLRGANLEGAKIGNTVFADVDLREVNGLNTCRHGQPSIIDFRTLQRSPLPLKFLRGCGLSDWEIEAAKLYQKGLNLTEITDVAYKLVELHGESPIQFYSCFISYSHTDKRFAHRLHDTLQERGIRCWLDEHQMLPGDDIYEQVDRGIRLWDKVLLCCSKAALEKSWWVDKEIDRAFEKERQIQKETGKRFLALIPLDLDGYLFSDEWENGKALHVRSRVSAKLKGWEDDDTILTEQIERVVKALRADDGDREPPPPSKLPRAANVNIS